MTTPCGMLKNILSKSRRNLDFVVAQNMIACVGQTGKVVYSPGTFQL